MTAVLSALPAIALAVAVLGSLFKGIAAMMTAYYTGRALVLSVQQKNSDPPDRLL